MVSPGHEESAELFWLAIGVLLGPDIREWWHSGLGHFGADKDPFRVVGVWLTRRARRTGSVRTRVGRLGGRGGSLGGLFRSIGVNLSFGGEP